LVAFYLLGAVSALVFNKKDALCSYISFLSASAGALLDLSFPYQLFSAIHFILFSMKVNSWNLDFLLINYQLFLFL